MRNTMTYNYVRVVGYLLQDPRIQNEGIEDMERVFAYIRTCRRDADDVDPDRFEDIMLMYDGDDEKVMRRMKALKQFDVIDVKGVLNILSGPKSSRCPSCGQINVKEQGTYTYVFPQHVMKLNNILNSFEYNPELPDAILTKHFKEISNICVIGGTVVTEPELRGTEKRPVCRYKLGVNRRFYVSSQPDLKADYPWVYSRGQQALDDKRHLEFDSIIMVDGYIHTRSADVPQRCCNCGCEYTYKDVVTDLIPYAVEYLKYKTDEDIEREEELKRRSELAASV